VDCTGCKSFILIGDCWSEEVRLMDEAVAAINKLQPQPRFLCLGGDILQALPGMVEVNESLKM